MSDINLLYRMIKDTSIISVEQEENGKRLLILEETGSAQDSGYSFEIQGVPEDHIAIKSDSFKAPVEFFERKKGQCRRSDYIIVAKYKDRNWIVFIELKRGKSDRGKIVQQLKGSQCLMDYCMSLGRTFWDRANFLNDGKYHKRFVSIKKISMNKRSHGGGKFNRAKGKIPHDSPGNMRTLTSSRRLQFKNLVEYY